MNGSVRRVVSYITDNGTKAIDSGDGTYAIYYGSKPILTIKCENIENWLGSYSNIIAELCSYSA